MVVMVTVDEAAALFPRLLERAAAGEDVLITRGGTPVAWLAGIRAEHRAEAVDAFERRLRRL